MKPSRRDFLRGAVGAAGAAAIGATIGRAGGRPTAPNAAGLGGARLLSSATPPLPNPDQIGIEHVVVVMMENRSFDHFFGWLPGANGTGVNPDGTVSAKNQARFNAFKYPAPDGSMVPIYNEKQLIACGLADQDHSYLGGRIQYDNNSYDKSHHTTMHGFLLDDTSSSNNLGPDGNTTYSLSYYLPSQRPFMMNLARNYTTCDNYFCSILGPTYPNRFFMHAAATDRLYNSSATSTLPTIWDQLNQVGGPTGRYYFSDVPFLALWGQKYVPISGSFAEFLADASAGTLPNVSFLDPRFVDEGDGTSNDDHPLADLRAGDSFLSEVFQAVTNGPGWDKTVLVINYDEWGGFFEHVPPVRVTPGVAIGAPASSGPDQDLDASGRVLTGLRVPCIVASPFTLGNPASPTVAHGFYDHTSVLKMIEWRWGLKPVSARDASNLASDPGNLAHVLNPNSPNAAIPALPQLLPFVPESCAAGNPPLGGTTGPTVNAGDDTWGPLLSSPLMQGWT